jgi:hypothetical protein
MPSPHAGALLDHQLITRSELPPDYRKLTKIDALSLPCIENGCEGRSAGVMCSLRWSTRTKLSPSVPLLCPSRIQRAKGLAQDGELAVEIIQIKPAFEPVQSFNRTPSRGRRTPQLVNEIKRRRELGQTNRQIASDLQIGLSTITNWLKA